MHQAPAWFHKLSAIIVLAIELVVPFFILFPGMPRYLAAAAFLCLMLLIGLTRNYGFFNLLGMALSALLINDRQWGWIIGNLPGVGVVIKPGPTPAWLTWTAAAVALAILALSLEAMNRLFGLEFCWPKLFAEALEWLAPFYLVNSYGLFALMTTERPEIILEGSSDGENWKEYELKWKPGNILRPPKFIAPHQPRLDWQMWFAALGYYENHSWLPLFLNRLLEGSSPVVALLKQNPFPQDPPKFIRGVIFDYRFGTRAERRQTGAWWRRERRGLYSPVIELKKAPPQAASERNRYL